MSDSTNQQVGSDDVGAVGGTSEQPQPSGSGRATRDASRSSDAQKKSIKRQLFLLMHANDCHLSEMANPSSFRCSITSCRTMRMLVAHLASCHLGRDCTRQYCWSSRRIFTHWTKCALRNCPLCTPLRKAGFSPAAARISLNRSTGRRAIHPPLQPTIQRAAPLLTQPFILRAAPTQLTAQRTNQPDIQSAARSAAQLAVQLLSQSTAQSTASNRQVLRIVANEFFDTTALPVPTTKEWQNCITPELRNDLVKKVLGVFPVPHPSLMRDSRRLHAVEYVRKVESEMFKRANSRPEYIRLLAEKIAKIQSEVQRMDMLQTVQLQRSLAQSLQRIHQSGRQVLQLQQQYIQQIHLFQQLQARLNQQFARNAAAGVIILRTPRHSLAGLSSLMNPPNLSNEQPQQRAQNGAQSASGPNVPSTSQSNRIVRIKLTAYIHFI